MISQRAQKCLYLILVMSLLVRCRAEQQPTPVAGQISATIQFTYDPNGNVKTRTDSSGNTTEYVYDALNQLTTILYPDKSSVKYVYNSLGQRTGMIDSLGTTSYEYDIHGRLVKVTDPNGKTLQYTYDSRDLLTQMVYPDGSVSAFTWDSNGQLASTQDVSGITSYEYNLGGKLTGRTLPNGVVTQYEYDDTGRLKATRHNSSNGDLLLGFEYELDAMGNRTQVTQMGPDGTQVIHYEYDNLTRLVGVTNSDGEKMAYEYDATGNRTKMVSSKAGDTIYTYNGLGQLAELNGPEGKITFTYDVGGNLVERSNKKAHETTNYMWNYENRLTGLDDGTTKISYSYDGNGSLVSKSSGGTTSYFLSDPLSSSSSIIAEYDDTGKIDTTYLYGNTLIGERDKRGVDRFFLEDGFGSVHQTVDERGMIIDAQDYSSFSESFVVKANELEVEAIDSAIYSIRKAWINGALADIPYVAQYQNVMKAMDLIFLARALWFTNHASGNLPKWLTGPDGPNALKATPAGHLVLAWDLLKGPMNLPYQISTKPINRLYDDGVRKIETSGFQTIEQYYSSTVEGPTSLRNYGYDTLTDTISKTVHTMIITTETSGFSRLDWAYQISQTTSANAQKKDEWKEALQRTSLEGLGRLVEKKKKWIDNDAFWEGPPNRPLPQGAAVGGISLDKAAQVLVNLNDIRGATYDPQTGQVTLIGRQDLSLPPMNMDDLVVAIRSIYGSSENPGVTMVPVDSTMKDKTQRVEYFGQTQDTHFGMVMFEADRYLKSLAAGTDSLTGQAVTPDVPGFKSELDLSFEMQTATPWHRNWFVPGKIVIKRSEDGRSMIFDEATIILQSHFIKFQSDGSLKDIPGSSPVTDQFSQFMDNHFDEFATEKTELAELKQLAKIVGLVRWLHDNNIPVDLSWVNDYQVATVDTPDTTPGIVAKRSDSSYSITSMGGVAYSTDNTYTEDVGGNANVLAEQAAASRPADYPMSWDLDYNGETLTAMAFNVAPTEILGSYTTSVTDLAIPALGGQTASFTRQYNSLDLSTGPLGSGWSQILPKLSFQKVPVPDKPDYDNTQAILTTGTDRRSFFFGGDGFFHPDDMRVSSEVLGITSGDLFNPISLPDGYSLRSGLAGQPLEFLDAQNRPFEYGGFALLKQDGSVLAFDSNGKPTDERDAEGHVLNYSYAGELLIAIADTAGHNIQFTYDSNNRLTDLTASNGQTIQYTYDSSGNLSGVLDETDARLVTYTYDADGRLKRIANKYGKVIEIAYDGLGRVVSSDSPSGSWTIQFNNKSNKITFTDPKGHIVSRQYDDQNRLLSETDPMGNSFEYQYDEEDHITSFTDRNGNATNFVYDKLGNLTEAVSPLGDRMIFRNYNEFGLPESTIDPANRITLYEYDESGRVINVKSGLQVTELSSDGNLRYQEVDPQSVTYSYDVAGNLATIQDTTGSVTQYAYDDFRNLVTMQLPATGEVRQTFDDRSRLMSVVDTTGNKVAFGYNEQGQLTNIVTSAGQTQYQYTDGLVMAITDPLNTTHQYSYDTTGQLTSVTEPNGSVTKYEYDATGNLAAVLDALGRRVEYHYDVLGQLLGIYR